MSRHLPRHERECLCPAQRDGSSVKSQESRAKKFCTISAVLTLFFAISAAFSRSPRFLSINLCLQTARAARGAKNFTREAKCHVMSRHLPGIRASSCHVASRHLPRSRRNMTLTFALDPRDILAQPKSQPANYSYLPRIRSMLRYAWGVWRIHRMRSIDSER